MSLAVPVAFLGMTTPEDDPGGLGHCLEFVIAGRPSAQMVRSSAEATERDPCVVDVVKRVERVKKSEPRRLCAYDFVVQAVKNTTADLGVVGASSHSNAPQTRSSASLDNSATT